MSKPGLLTLTIRDKSALYLAYMPFVRNGGLFIPTSRSYRIGDEVFMLLNIMGEDEKIPVAGRVIWVTPKGAQGKRTAGIGVQFSDQDGATQKRIENYLAGALGGDKTHPCDVRWPTCDLRRGYESVGAGPASDRLAATQDSRLEPRLPSTKAPAELRRPVSQQST